MSIYIQIGAGAGDQDARAKYRDGFTEYVKTIDPKTIEKILLIEPNPHNIEALRKCWSKYPQAEILQVGICPSSQTENSTIFYYADEDAPHYQVFSMIEAHVRKHYKNGTIRKVAVETITISELLSKVIRDKPIDLLAIDIEGIDAEVILDIDWLSAPCKKVSFEFIHMGPMEQVIHDALTRAGYICIGWGLDVNHLDCMYAKPSTWKEAVVHRVWQFWFWLRVRLWRQLKANRKNSK